MAIDRGLGIDLATELAELHRVAETELLRLTARRLARGLDAPEWAQRKLAELSAYRRDVSGLLERLQSARTGLAARTLARAWVRGGEAASVELRGLGIEAAPVKNAPALAVITQSLVTLMQGTNLPVLRWALDAFRAVVAPLAGTVLAGALTRRQASERAWNKLIDQGVTAFRDRSGRKWSLSAYVEMATRSAVVQATVEAHTATLVANGVELVQVSNAPQECIMCRPWEGKVLTLTGGPGARTVRVEHATDDGRFISVRVAGSLTEAVAAGLFHPNCRHRVVAYLPGVTKPLTHTADPKGDEARQELRRLERGVRRWKMREAGALTPEARAEAKKKVRQWQSAIAAHTGRTGLIRQRARERLPTRTGQ